MVYTSFIMSTSFTTFTLFTLFALFKFTPFTSFSYGQLINIRTYIFPSINNKTFSEHKQLKTSINKININKKKQNIIYVTNHLTLQRLGFFKVSQVERGFDSSHSLKSARLALQSPNMVVLEFLKTIFLTIFVMVT